jgi:lipopolysaccharide export LptBFGC system permease protein LptF
VAKGLQGRYAIPLLPALAIVLAPPLWVRNPRLRRAVCAVAVALASIPIAATLREGLHLSTR